MKFQELFSILHETPMPIEPLYNDPHSVKLKPIDKHVPERDYSETINIKGIELDVRINTPSSGWNRFFFYKGDQVVAVFSGMEISNDRIVTQMTNTRKGVLTNDSLLGEIYTNYLLKKYHSIISDGALTPQGFNFWKRNFDKFVSAGYQVNIVDFSMLSSNPSRHVTTLKSSDELEEFYHEYLSSFRFEVANP